MGRKYPNPIDFINAISTLDELDRNVGKRSLQLLNEWGEISLIAIHRQGRDEEFWDELLSMFPQHFFDKHPHFCNAYGRKPRKEITIKVDSYASIFYPMFK